MHTTTKTLSGGPTGDDRTAFDWPIFHDTPHGGWCPKGRKAEDGVMLGEVAEPASGTFGKLSLLLAWHRQESVSDEERRRNDRIFALQGSRNPLVDRKEFVEAVYLPNPE